MNVRPIINPDAPPYLSAREHLHDRLERVRHMVKRYMRRYSDRFLQRDRRYSDMVVGPDELRRLAGLEQTDAGDAFLDNAGFPNTDAINEALLLQKYEMDSRAAAVESAEIPLSMPINELKKGFVLSDLELDLLIAAAAPRLSIDLSRLMSVAIADFTSKQPTAGFLAEVVAEKAEHVPDIMDLLTDDSPLVQYRLLVPAQHPRWTPRTPRVHAYLHVPERVLGFLRGHKTDSTAIIGCQVFHDGLAPGDLVLPGEDDLEDLERHLARKKARIGLVGPVASGRRTVARSLTVDSGARLLTVDLVKALTATTPDAVVVQLAEILREARLHHASVFVRLDGLGDSDLTDHLQVQLPQIQELLKGFPAPVFVGATSTSQKYISMLFSEIPEITLNAPPSSGQRKLWDRALDGLMAPARLDVVASDLSRTYRLPPGSIFRAVDVAREQATDQNDVDRHLIIKMVRKQFDHGLGWLADAINVNMDLDDVVMSDLMREQIDEIIVYARNSETVFHRWGFADKSPTGRGLSVMFSGPPGTGKTLLAGVLARELGRICYRVDLSRVVDKYIGETEKNLGKVFDEADRAQAVLLFDEADSLFAKRTKVKSSNDRYANLEVNYLLQRLDAYAGVSILTTNFVTSIDDAFQRRIRFKIEFPMPDAEMRETLWQTLIPPEAPVDDDIDWQDLADMFEFSGGHIRNAVLRAAVHAAEKNSPITEEMLLDAGTAESREMGKLVRQGWGADMPVSDY